MRMRMPRILTLTLIWIGLIAFVACGSAAEGIKGHLVIIGGGKRTPEIMQRFIALAGGGEKARIVVLPMASGTPESTGIRQVEEFKSYGAKNVSFRMFTRRQALSDSAAGWFRGVTGIFFSGGAQSRITAIIAGTPVHRMLMTLYRDGAVIGGTSAGAAVMSKVMITGDEALNSDTTNAFIFVKKNNIKTDEGLGFIDNAIVDQHFVKRKRHNRLISLVLEQPQLLGIGIDEATAIIVNPDNTFDVLGDATVFVYDATGASSIGTDFRGNPAAQNIRMSILTSGSGYDIKLHSMIPASK